MKFDLSNLEPVVDVRSGSVRNDLIRTKGNTEKFKFSAGVNRTLGFNNDRAMFISHSPAQKAVLIGVVADDDPRASKFKRRSNSGQFSSERMASLLDTYGLSGVANLKLVLAGSVDDATYYQIVEWDGTSEVTATSTPDTPAEKPAKAKKAKKATPVQEEVTEEEEVVEDDAEELDELVEDDDDLDDSYRS